MTDRRLNDVFTEWVGGWSLTSIWLVVVCDALAVLLVVHALRRRRQGYYWWEWSLALVPVALGLGLLFALNDHYRTMETVRDLVRWMQ